MRLAGLLTRSTNGYIKFYYTCAWVYTIRSWNNRAGKISVCTLLAGNNQGAGRFGIMFF